MSDREKTIDSLEADAQSCGDMVLIPSETYYDTLELLKEQEPVKPKTKSRHGEYPEIVHRCGACNTVLCRHNKYCPNCGRVVKWE